MPRRYVNPALALAVAVSLSPAPASAEGCVMDAWERMLAPGFQQHELVERIATDRGPVVVLGFTPLKGEHAKLWIFLLDDGTCFTHAVVAGSYEATTLMARQTGRIGPDARLYHFDLYTGDSHATLGFRETPPGYEEAKRIALEALR